MKITADDARYALMSNRRREFISMAFSCYLTQEEIALLLGVKADVVNRWARPERQGTVEPPCYAVSFMRSYVLLTEPERKRLFVSEPLIDVDYILREIESSRNTRLKDLPLLAARGRELVAMMAVCRVNQRSLSDLLGIHSVTINRWLRPEREDAKVAPFHALNFMRAFYLLPEDKRLKLNSTAPLIDVDAALRGEGIIFVR